MSLEIKKKLINCYIIANLLSINRCLTISSQLKKRIEATDVVLQTNAEDNMNRTLEKSESLREYRI